jgi:hypothetical protein
MKNILLATTALLLLLPMQSVAQDGVESEGDVVESSEETPEAEEKLPFGGSITLGSSVGMGTFANEGYAQRDLVVGFLGLGAYYSLADSQRLSAGLDMSTYLASNADSGLGEDQETLLGDAYLTYSYSGIWSDDDLGLSLSGSLRTFFPTSKYSQYATKIMGLNPYATLSGNWSWFSASYTLLYTHNFYEYDHPGVESNGSQLACINRTEVESGMCFAGGYANSQLSVGNSLTLGFKAMDELSFALTYALIHGFGFDNYPNEDEFTAENAVPGKRQRDISQGVVSATYRAHKYVSIGLSLSTVQPPKTSDAKGFRFPFFDGSANNFTTIGLSATASY